MSERPDCIVDARGIRNSAGNWDRSTWSCRSSASRWRVCAHAGLEWVPVAEQLQKRFKIPVTLNNHGLLSDLMNRGRETVPWEDCGESDSRACSGGRAGGLEKGRQRAKTRVFGRVSETLKLSFHSKDSVSEAFDIVGWVGLEPTTNALKGRCSTVELPTRHGHPMRTAAHPPGR
jgi:hypothetical protein